MLTSRTHATVEHPTEEGVTFTFRRLNYKHIEEAVFKRREAAMALSSMMGDLKLPEGIDMDALVEAARQDNAAEKEADPSLRYDKTTVLKYGLVKWSYVGEADAGECICGAAHLVGVAIPCDETHKADLDDDTVTWAFDEVMRLTLRDKDEGEASGSNSMPTSA